MIIAIDGLAVNGKTTLAERIAKETGFKKFSAGTIYRCIALEIVNKKLDINDIKNTIYEIENIEIETYLNKELKIINSSLDTFRELFYLFFMFSFIFRKKSLFNI